ncbi:MAG: caspase family protein, partial [Gammaproteobacteria bacterium]
TYSSSTYGDLLVGWQINRGPDATPDFFRAVQFERELYQPDAIAARLQSFGAGNAGAGSVTAIAGNGAGRLLSMVPPRLQVTVQAANAGGATIRVSGESTGLPMQDLAVYVNDIPITAGRQRRLDAREGSRFVRDIPLALGAADNDIRVEVFNGRSLGVAERFVPNAAPAQATAPVGDLYVLAAGSNQFPELSPSQYLSYAATDAETFARTIQASAGRRFRKVNVQTLSDSGRPATKANVLAALQWMAAQSTGADTLIVFLASHGISDIAGNYYFVPRDVRRGDLDVLLDDKMLPGESSLIGWLPFFETLRGAAGRRLLIVDTCQARNISGRFEDFSLVKRSASSHMAFILASKGDEESQEYTQAQHGLFTFALLDGLRAGDVAGTRPTVSQWFNYASSLVDKLRDRRIGPQTPQLLAPPALLAMPVP